MILSTARAAGAKSSRRKKKNTKQISGFSRTEPEKERGCRLGSPGCAFWVKTWRIWWPKQARKTPQCLEPGEVWGDGGAEGCCLRFKVNSEGKRGKKPPGRSWKCLTLGDGRRMRPPEPPWRLPSLQPRPRRFQMEADGRSKRSSLNICLAITDFRVIIAGKANTNWIAQE